MVKLKKAFALSLSLIIFLLAGFSFTFNNYLNSDTYETENISIKEISLSNINSNSLNASIYFNNPENELFTLSYKTDSYSGWVNLSNQIDSDYYKLTVNGLSPNTIYQTSSDYDLLIKINENDKVYSAGYFSTTNFNQSNSNDYKVSANYLNGSTILSVDYDDSKDSIITSIRVNGVLTEKNDWVETKANISISINSRLNDLVQVVIEYTTDPFIENTTFATFDDVLVTGSSNISIHEINIHNILGTSVLLDLNVSNLYNEEVILKYKSANDTILNDVIKISDHTYLLNNLKPNTTYSSSNGNQIEIYIYGELKLSLSSFTTTNFIPANESDFIVSLNNVFDQTQVIIDYDQNKDSKVDSILVNSFYFDEMNNNWINDGDTITLLTNDVDYNDVNRIEFQFTIDKENKLDSSVMTYDINSKKSLELWQTTIIVISSIIFVFTLISIYFWKKSENK